MDKTEFGSTAFLIPVHQNRYSSQKRERNTVIAFKIIQLITLIVCASLYSIGAHLEIDVFKIAIAYSTFGAYLVISLSALIGHYTNEPAPKLKIQMLYNLIGAIMFILTGAFSVNSWWYLQDQLDIASRNTDVSEIQHESNMKLLAGMVAISNGVFYLVEANFSVLLYIINH